MDTELAIVIPAYKCEFLRETLESIANQTCKDFNLYIGDDCSPYNLKTIVDDITFSIPVTYQKFDDNMGAVSLVKQWERCISMTKHEKWIWLFSDDDVMGERCVELFYESLNNLKQGEIYDLFHYDVKLIDKYSNITGTRPAYPQNWSSFQFYQGITSCQYCTAAPEYIFSREIYALENGFTEIDLGWGSDIATWAKFASRHGIHTLHGDYVYFRESGINITSDNSAHVLSRKMLALLDFYKWSVSYFGNIEELFQTNYVYFSLRLHLFKYCTINWFSYIKQFHKIHGNGRIRELFRDLILVFLFKLKVNIKKMLHISYIL